MMRQIGITSERSAPSEPADAAGGIALTEEQRHIVEWGDGPAVVIAGAGTGKTRVIVERVRWLLESKAAEGLLPEHLLVLTYNVKAAAELRDRIEHAVGIPTAARITVSNFHSFCHGVLTDNAGEAGLPGRPDVLDGVGQLLLLRDIAPTLGLVYHGTDFWTLANLVGFINRCKDELVTPADVADYVQRERTAFEERFGDVEAAMERLDGLGNLQRLKKEVRPKYAAERAGQRAGTDANDGELAKAADREARRTIAGDGSARRRNLFPLDDLPRIDALAATYEADGAALEVLRLVELAVVYRAYEAELARRGALDYGEQIAAVTQLFKVRPNILRRYQRRYRYILVDEFQDANVAQIELIELLGRAPDRSDNVMVVGDDDQSIYRFRGASFAAFAEFERRFAGAPAHDPDGPAPGPPPRLRLEQNFRSVRHVLTGANRVIANNGTRFMADKALWTDRHDGDPIEVHHCAGPDDEAVAVVDALKALVGDGGRWGDAAILYRKHKHREAIVARLRDEGIPYTVIGGLSLFSTPEIRDLEQGLRAITDPTDDRALVRMLSAGPGRLDALEILRVSRAAAFDKRHLVEAMSGIVETGRLDEAGSEGDVDPALRSKLRQVLATIDELNPLTFREGPHTIVERYLERTGTVLDLIATDTLEAKRAVANIASFVRFAADWQRADPGGTLAQFVTYLTVYQEAGGELPTSVELNEDAEGVRLMTLYQAKGLEFPIVIVPQLVDGEWPTKPGWEGYFPRELLREAVPEGDVHTDEERRLLYVAMTRAQERLVLTTEPAAAAPWLTFGSTAHAAFEAFTKARREAVARGEPPPTREDLEREFRSRWVPTAFGDREAEERYGKRVATLLDNFWEGELATLGEAIHEELDFELRLDPGEGHERVVLHGQIDRIDRLPSGAVEVIDYKTGSIPSQRSVDESLQLSIYALACRDALDLGTPERVTLYFTESAQRLSTTRTDEQLDAARDDILARATRIRSGDFAATPSGEACRRCDYRAMCPERV